MEKYTEFVDGKICSTQGCTEECDNFNTRCSLCFQWARMRARIREYAYNERMCVKFASLDWESLEYAGLDHGDYPDYCDAYVSKAYWNNGIELTDEELDTLTAWMCSTGAMHAAIFDDVLPSLGD